jgi:hypothetical protein
LNSMSHMGNYLRGEHRLRCLDQDLIIVGDVVSYAQVVVSAHDDVDSGGRIIVLDPAGLNAIRNPVIDEG